MLRVSKVDEWLNRPRDAERAHAGLRAHRDGVIIRSGRLAGGPPPVSPAGPPGPGARVRLHLALIPPGTRGAPHFHAGHETAVYIVSGETEVWHGAGLARRSTARAGDVVCIPPGAPHLAVNRGEVTSIAVVARTGQQEQPAAVVLELPRHLAGLLSLPVAIGA